MILQLDPNATSMFDTFNPVTIITALVSGGMLGFFAFVPILTRLTPRPGPSPYATARSAFWVTYLVTGVILSIVVVTFYIEQIGAELIVINLDPTIPPPPWPRQLGRMFSFLVFVQALAIGMSSAVYRDVKDEERRIPKK